MSLLLRSLCAAYALAVASWVQAAVCSVGDQALVNWKGKEYPAKVLKVNEDQTRCYIKYTGYGDEWNEWVGPDRLRIPGREISVSTSRFKVGDSVDVKWKGSWYPASVLSVKNGRYKIHYDGYGSNWDEWVSDDRIRSR